MSSYNDLGYITSYYLNYPEAEVRTTYQYSNNFLTTSYLLEVNEKFFPGGFVPVDSVYIELNSDNNLIRQERYQRQSGAFVLSNEIINSYNTNQQITSKETYFRNPYQEERTIAEYTYRCDGELMEIQRTIIDAKPVTTLGNQSLERYSYMRNDNCIENNVSELTLYPNPADQYVGLEVPPGITGMKVRIITTSGQPVREYSVETEFPYFRLDTSQLSEGFYIIQIQSDSHSSSQRLVVNRG